MRSILKVNNSDLSFRLKLNYNNVYSRLKMVLGKKAAIFADLSTKSTTTTWYTDDEKEYTSLAEAPKTEYEAIVAALGDEIKRVHKEISSSAELAPYVDDLLDVPDEKYIFYRRSEDGYKFLLTGWGCKQAHSIASQSGGLSRRLRNNFEEEIEDSGKTTINERDFDGRKEDKTSKEQNRKNIFDRKEEDKKDLSGRTEPVTEKKEEAKVSEKTPSKTETKAQTKEESGKTVAAEEVKKEETQIKKKTQHVQLKVINQNGKPIEDELVKVETEQGESTVITNEDGIAEIGNLTYHSNFVVSFPDMPNIQSRTFEVEPKVETYEAHVKKLVKYSPVLFVEDQNGNIVEDYNVKLYVGGQDSMVNTGTNGMVQLPTMTEGQKFMVVDAANYANTQEYSVTPESVKNPFRFTIRRPEKVKVGIAVYDKEGKPIEGVAVNVVSGDKPCQQTTKKDGRAEFPMDLFEAGDVPLTLQVPGKGQIKSRLKFDPNITEYTIQIGGKKPHTHNTLSKNLKWLGLIPLLALLGWGGYKLWPHNVPISTLEKGVVLIQSEVVYFVETGFQQADGSPYRFYFTYDENEKKYGDGTFDINQAVLMRGTGTGFLISPEGHIATNRHVADPIPPKGAASMVKDVMVSEKQKMEEISETINDRLRTIGPLRLSSPELNAQYEALLEQQKMAQEYIKMVDKMLTVGDFEVKTQCRTSVAFVNSIIESWDDFKGCSFRISGDPGDVNAKDVAIIQLKNKERDLPADAYIYDIPKKDIMDGEIPDNYEVTVLGYNAGLQLADIKNGIHPQPTKGLLTIKSDKYNFGYDANTFGGSSGSPVLNKDQKVIGVNNANLGNGSGKGFAVRTKYLRELMDEIGLNPDKKK